MIGLCLQGGGEAAQPAGRRTAPGRSPLPLAPPRLAH
eukprot:CAMPEP_0179182652 /NCGR_PEP_ID=MMETSP0796-20121207/90506_1 /TAXON_ID=73915 /ORGANISM="Pyrodinium bahamense, Strain pbaha01" /LENGTH=36 /DNA_ID= /DNA_START= /DNA_END= /DNA_ORIENTATION=